MNSLIIIPSLEPNLKLIELVKELKRLGLSKIVVVDDGSDNSYQHIFDELSLLCTVYHHDVNKGKGAALKTAISKYDDKDICGYVTADSDYQHLPKDILKVALELENNNDNIVLGVRNFNLSNVPFKSKYGNKFSSLFFKFKTGVKCSDTQTGLRGIPKKYKSFALSVLGERFEYEMNFLTEAAIKHIKFTNIEIETVYENNNSGSHFRPFHDSILIYKEPLRFIFIALTSALIDLGLFTLLVNILGRTSSLITASTITARIISGAYNFTLNKYWSFKSNGKTYIEAFKYLILFLCNMFLSSLFVSLLSKINIDITILKIIVDVILSVINYLIQKKLIFINRYVG